MTLSSNTLRAVVCAAIVITAIPAGILTFSSTATAAVDGDVDIDPDDSSPSFDKDINAGREYEFDFVVSYNLPDGESGVINLYLADAGGRQIQKEVIGTGDYEDVTISVTEFVARERVGEGFYISTILRDSNDEFVEGDDKEYTVTAPGEPPSIDNATPPGDETVIVEKGETRTFEINASDPDGDDLDYTWRLRKEAVGSDYQKVGSGSTHSQTFDVELDDGNTAYRLQVEITDPYHSITYDWLIDVQKENNNRSPSVTRITPESSEFIANAGDDVQFEIEATDQDADLDRVDWYLNGDKQITRSFTNDVTTTDSKTFTFDTDGKHTVRAVVTDSNGNKDTATWNSALADLRVTNVELVPSDPAAGEPTDFRVKIQNIGDKPAETVTVNTFVDGELVGVPPATDLAPGESDKTVLTGDYKFDEGSHTVSAVVNPDNNIPESNKNNNKNTLETNIGAYDGYSVTLTDFDYSISTSSHANSGVGRTENYNTSTTIKSKGIADVSVGSRAGPIVAQSSSQGVALVGAKWEAPHSGDTKVGLTSSTTGSATVTPDDYPLATNLGYSGRAVASQSIVIYDRTDNEIVKQSQTKLSDIKAPTTNEWLVDSAIKIVGTVGLGSTLSKKVGSKGGGFVAKGVADTVGGEIQSQLLSKAAGLVVNDDHTRKVDRKSSMVVSFEAEKGHEYAIYQRVSAGTGTLGITERAVGAEVDIKSDVEEIQIYTDEQTGGPPNLQISQTPSRYVSDPDNAVVEAQAEFSDDSDTTPEIGFRLVSPDGIQDDWLYQSSEIKRFSLGDLIDNVQPGEYVVEFQARDPRTGIESGVISVPVTVTSDPQVELGVTEETENGATLGMSIKSVAPVEHIELQTKQAGEWTSWQTVSPNLSPVYDSPGETMIRGRAIDVAGNRGEWNMVTVTVPDSSSVIADAGDDQTVTAGETVALDATGSSSPDQSELGYRFKQLSQPDSLPDVSLQDPETQTPEFTAPDVDSETTVTFELTVTNSAGTTTTDTDTDTDQVNITIIPADDEDADGMSADAALSFEQGDTGETPPAPWSIIRDPTAPGFEAVEISEQHATDGSQTLHMTGNGELDRILVGFDANLSNVETVRVDVYLERANVYIGEIWFGRRVDGESQKTVDVMGQTGEGPNRFGTTGEFTNVEGDVSDLSGEHELVFNVRGDNEAYFDEIEFLDADGNVVPAAQVVVEADNRGPPGGGDGDDSDELLSVPFKTSFETGLGGWTVNQRFRTGEKREPGAGEFPQSILSRGDGEYSDQYDGSVRLGVNGGPSSIGVARNTSGIQNGTQISAKFNSDSFSGEPGRVRLLLYPPGEGNQNEIGLDSRGGQSDADEVVLSGTVSEDYPPGTQIRLTADVWPGEYDIYVTNISAQVPQTPSPSPSPPSIPTPPDQTGVSTGDPHIITFDGLAYDFQAAGEFTLFEDSQSVEIQSRQLPVTDSDRDATVNTAIATLVDGSRVMIDARSSTEPSVIVDGTPIQVTATDPVSVGDGMIFYEEAASRYTVVYPGDDSQINDGDTQLIADIVGDRLDITVHTAPSNHDSVQGLLGDIDSDTSNDIALANGTVLAQPPTFDSLYGPFRTSWRVTDTTSLFYYDDGNGPETYYQSDMPTAPVTIEDFPDSEILTAREKAQNAGLKSGSVNFRNAVLDYLLTGESSYFDSAQHAPKTPASNLTVPDRSRKGDDEHHYEFIETEVTWQEAREAASERTHNGRQGYLVTITSKEEQELVQSLTTQSAWIGASDAAEEGTWRWVTGPEGKENEGKGRHFFTQSGEGGTAIDGQYAKWDAGEPNNLNDEDYAHLYASANANAWNDNDRTKAFGYIVEYGGTQQRQSPERPPASVTFTDQTLPNGSSTVTVDTAQFGNESVPGEKFVVVVHKTTESIYDDEIGPKVGESDVLSPGTQQSVEVDLSRTLGPSDDIDTVSNSQSLVAMLHRADTDDDEINHGPHITRNGDTVTSRAQVTVSPPPGDLVADAGPDQTVTAGKTVELDASGSTAPDESALTYAFQQVSQPDSLPDVSLQDPETQTPEFTAPDVDSETTLTFELTITQTDSTGTTTDTDTDTDTDQVNITITPADDPLPTTSLRFTDQTLPNGSSTVTVDTAQFGNESVPGEKFVVVVHKTTESIYDDEIGPKVGESDVLSPGTRQSVEVDLSQTLAPSDDMAELTESQSLVAMLHRADTTDGDGITHGAHITRDGDKVTSRAQLTVSSSSAPAPTPALRTHRNLTSTKVTNGSTVTVTVTGSFNSPTDDAKLVDIISGGEISAENLTITDAAGAAFPVTTSTPTPTVDITWNGTLGTVSEAKSFTVKYEVQIPADTPVGTIITFDGTVTDSTSGETTGIDGDSSIEVVATTSPDTDTDTDTDTVTVGGQEVPTEFTSETNNGDRTVTADNAVEAINTFIAGDVSADVAVDVINAFIAS